MYSRMRTCAVAAAALLIAACAGTRHDAESSNVRNGSEAGPHAPVETDTNANAKVPEIPVELSPQIHEACRPYRIAEPALTLPSNSDSKVRREFGGLTHCLTHGPLHDHELEIVGPDPAKSYLSEAVEPLRRVLIDGGVNAYRLKIVPAADADRVTLRLGNPESDS